MDSVIHVHVSILPQIALPPSLPHHIEQSSLCYTVGPCWLSILNIARGPPVSSPTTRGPECPAGHKDHLLQHQWDQAADGEAGALKQLQSHIKGWELCLGQGEPSGLETDECTAVGLNCRLGTSFSLQCIFFGLQKKKKKKCSYFFNDIHMKVQILSFF